MFFLTGVFENLCYQYFLLCHQCFLPLKDKPDCLGHSLLFTKQQIFYIVEI